MGSFSRIGRPVILAVFFVSLFCQFAYAGIRFGLAAGDEYGLGLKGRIGPEIIKLDVGAGIMPVFILWNTDFGDTYFKLYFPANAGAKLSIALRNDEGHRVGLNMGLNHNSIMKTGFGGGIDYVAVNKPFGLLLSGGFMFFPDAYDRLLERLNEEERTDYRKDELSAPFVNFRPYVGIAFLFGQ